MRFHSHILFLILADTFAYGIWETTTFLVYDLMTKNTSTFLVNLDDGGISNVCLVP
jgi:hypothetical protein